MQALTPRPGDSQASQAPQTQSTSSHMSLQQGPDQYHRSESVGREGKGTQSDLGDMRSRGEGVGLRDRQMDEVDEFDIREDLRSWTLQGTVK